MIIGMKIALYVLDAAMILAMALLLLLMRLNYRNVTIRKKEYDLATGASKFASVATIAFFVFGIGLFAGSIPLTYFGIFEGAWILFGLGIFFGGSALILFYNIYFCYVAIKGRTVFLFQMFGKKKEIPIKAIKSIVNQGYGFRFLDESGKSLFNIDAMTKGLEQFVHLLAVRQNDDVPLDEEPSFEEALQAEEREEKKAFPKLEEYGERVRKDCKRNPFLMVNYYLIIATIVVGLAGIFLLFYLLHSYRAFLIVFFAGGYLIFHLSPIISLFGFQKRKNAELARTYGLIYPEVKGHKAMKRTSIRAASLMTILLSIVTAGFSFPSARYRVPTNLSSVTGQIVKVGSKRVDYTESKYIVLGGKETTYYVVPDYVYLIPSDLSGKECSLLYRNDPAERKEKGVSYTSFSLYGIESDGVTYLSQYYTILAHQKVAEHGRIVTFTFAGLAALGLIAFLITIAVPEKEHPEETVDLGIVVNTRKKWR